MATPRTPRNKISPPLKGSFPLDHDGTEAFVIGHQSRSSGECKEQMEAYMKCLRETGANGRVCREESRLYLACRMEKDLMAKEPLETLGFKDLMAPSSSSSEAPRDGTKSSS